MSRKNSIKELQIDLCMHAVISVVPKVLRMHVVHDQLIKYLEQHHMIWTRLHWTGPDCHGITFIS